MVHGDDSGLVLPPKIAPVQVDIIPVQQQKEGVLDKAREIAASLKGTFTVKIDDADKSPGWKFAEQEMRGIPVRIEIGPKDIENGQCVIVRRDTREKYSVAFENVKEELARILDVMQKEMFERAKKHRDEHISDARSYDEFKEILEKKPGFIRAMWCESKECELKIKEDTTATSRCIPFEQEKLSDVCVCCGKPATKMVYWGKAY